MNVIWYNILEILIIYAVFWGSNTFSAICLEKLFYFLDECPPAEKRFDCRHFLICESSESLMAIKSDFIFFASKAPLPQQQGDHSHELQDNCSAPFRFHHLCILPPCTQTLPRGDRRWRGDPGEDRRRWRRSWGGLWSWLCRRRRWRWQRRQKKFNETISTTEKIQTSWTQVFRTSLGVLEVLLIFTEISQMDDGHNIWLRLSWLVLYAKWTVQVDNFFFLILLSHGGGAYMILICKNYILQVFLTAFKKF